MQTHMRHRQRHLETTDDVRTLTSFFFCLEPSLYTRTTAVLKTASERQEKQSRCEMHGLPNRDCAHLGRCSTATVRRAQRSPCWPATLLGRIYHTRKSKPAGRGGGDVSAFNLSRESLSKWKYPLPKKKGGRGEN